MSDRTIRGIRYGKSLENFFIRRYFCITSSCEDNDEWKGIIAERIGTELVLPEGLVCYNNIKDGGEIGVNFKEVGLK